MFPLTGKGTSRSVMPPGRTSIGPGCSPALAASSSASRSMRWISRPYSIDSASQPPQRFRPVASIGGNPSMAMFSRRTRSSRIVPSDGS